MVEVNDYSYNMLKHHTSQLYRDVSVKSKLCSFIQNETSHYPPGRFDVWWRRQR